MKIAYHIDESFWVEKKGVEVSDDRYSFGRKITHQLKYPKMCLVFDETGCNTLQKKGWQTWK